jgi:hypothetical protein
MANYGRKGRMSIICPRNRRFENIVVCAANCRQRCRTYYESITIEVLLRFIEEHPEYELQGEIMPAKKQAPITGPDRKYWVILEENRYLEVTEEELTGNPQEYIGKEIWDRPPHQYELVVTLRKKNEK